MYTKTEITIGSGSHLSASNNNGSITSSAGSGSLATTKISDNGFKPNGEKMTSTITIESSNDRTFTSAGSQPGDNQSLTIKSKNTLTDEEKTEYEVYGILALGAASQYNFGEAPISNKTVTTEETRTQSYNANHNLGKNGEAVGGKLNASSQSSASFEVAYGGTSHDNQNGTTYEIVLDATSSGYLFFRLQRGQKSQAKSAVSIARLVLSRNPRCV